MRAAKLAILMRSPPVWVPTIFRQQAGAVNLYANASVANIDGTYGRAWLPRLGRDVSLASILTRTGTAGTALNADGSVRSFTSTALRCTDAGLTTEEARTNSVRNNQAFTANWLQSTVSGITASQVGTGTENGLPYVEVRWNGTASASGNLNVYSETSIGIAALTTQTWTYSPFARISAGSASGINSFKLVMDENTSGGSFVTNGSTTITAPTSAALTGQRYLFTRTLSGGATVAAVRPYWNMPVSNGAVVDITLRIFQQMEQGSFATTPILTSGSAVARNQDGLSFSDVSWLTQGGGTLYAKATFESAPTTFGRIIVLSDGSESNQFVMETTTGALTQSAVISGGVNLGSRNGVSITPGSTYKIAVGIDGLTYRMANNGVIVAPGTLSGAYPSSLSVASVGRGPTGTGPTSAVIAEMAVFASPLSDAGNAALTQ